MKSNSQTAGKLFIILMMSFHHLAHPMHHDEVHITINESAILSSQLADACNRCDASALITTLKKYHELSVDEQKKVNAFFDIQKIEGIIDQCDQHELLLTKPFFENLRSNLLIHRLVANASPLLLIPAFFINDPCTTKILTGSFIGVLGAMSSSYLVQCYFTSKIMQKKLPSQQIRELVNQIKKNHDKNLESQDLINL